MAPLLLFYCFYLIFLNVASANENLNTILLIGSESFNEHKLPILQHFHPNADNIFDQKTFTPNIHIFGNHNDQFKDDQYLQFHTIDTNQSLILTLKGTNELSLDELQLLHKLIYQINNGIIVIELGPAAIQTTSLLDYSTFCWANAHLDLQLSEEENRVFLCNGVKPSSVIDFIDEQSIVRSNKQIEPAALPTAPQPRFWPSFIVSAAEVDSKKQRSSKHTAQPNARQTRVYGNKDKKKSETKTEDEPQSENVDKLKCKYRKSCYGGEDPPVIKHAPVVKQEPKKIDVNSADKVEDKTSNDFDKLKCKYRKSCYDDQLPQQEAKIDDNEEKIEAEDDADDEEVEIKPVEPKPVKKEEKPSKSKSQKHDKKQEKKQDRPQHESKNDETGKVQDKLNCKYRKSCYESGVLDLEAIQKAKTHTPVKETKSSEDIREIDDDDETSKKVACKYRKSCYESGKLDLNAIQAAKTHTPVKETKSSKDVREIDDDDELSKKVACKYRKSCMETGILNMEAIHKAKTHTPVKETKSSEDVKEIDEDDELSKKVACKYRKSCMETGILNMEAIHKAKTHTPVKETKSSENVREIDEDDELSKKVACKYRKSCYESGKLDINAIHAAKTHTPVKETKEEPQKVDNELDIKLKCKYRKDCIQNLAKKQVDEEKPPSHEHRKKKTKKEEEPIEEIPVVIEEVEIEKETPEIIEKQPRKSKKEKPIEIKEEEPVEEEEEEDLTSKPSKKSLHKSKEVSAEYKKKDPHRYVNTFKTVGRYEKLPKNDTLEEEEGEEEKQPESEQEENEVEDASIEIAEPIVQTVIEDDDEQQEEESADDQEIEEEPIVSEQQKIDEEPIVIGEQEDTYANEEISSSDVNNVDISSVPLETKVSCKYRRSCMQTGILPDLEEERKNAKIRETVRVHSPIDAKSKDEVFDKLDCKYRYSCYSKFEKEAKQEDKVLQKKLDDQKVKEKKPLPIKKDDDEKKEQEDRINKTVVVDLDSISTKDRLQCKYRQSCYSGIETVQQKSTAYHTVVPIPVESLRIKNQKCHIYYLSCREEMGLPPKEHAPVVNGRRLCRKKKPNEQKASE